MRAVMMYEADDGSRWDTLEKAQERDAVMRDVSDLYRILGLRKTPKGTDFANGGGYVQQPAGSRDALLAWLKVKGAHRDSVGPVGQVMNRMHRMDDNDREWGQPYFAMNPHEGKQESAV